MGRILSGNVVGGDARVVGSVIDLAGVPNVHQDGTSSWLRSGTWVRANQLPDEAINKLAASYDLAALATNAVVEGFSQLNSIQRPGITESVTCFPIMNVGSTALYALTVDADGVSVNPVGMNAGYGAVATHGGGSLITSDGETLYCWTQTGSHGGFDVCTSEDGINWSEETPTGAPTFQNTTNVPMGSSAGGGSHGDVLATGTIYANGSGTAGVQFVEYFGARHVAIARKDTSYYIATIYDGLSSGGDETVDVLGSATVSLTNAAWWHHSPSTLKGFIAVGSVARYTVDGGITWSDASSFSFGNPVASQKFQVNKTDPDRLYAALSGSELQVSVDCGASWTLRTMPISSVTSISARDGTILVSNGTVAYKSNDDGATWVIISGIGGMAGTVRGVYADATRFYLHTSGNQIVKSTDASTWIVSNITNQEGTSSILTNIVAANSDVILISSASAAAGGPALYTMDGGVTWRWVLRSAGAEATASYSTSFRLVDTGTTVLIGGAIGGSSGTISRKTSAVIEVANIQAGAASVRASSSEITSLRTNAAAYICVA